MTYDLAELKQKSILDYMERSGFELHKDTAGTFKCSSPFSSDSNPSFVIYEKDNNFYDFSTGINGDIFDLVCKLEEVGFQEACRLLSEMDFKSHIKPVIKEDKKDFFLVKNLEDQPASLSLIQQYALSRRLTTGWVGSKFFTKDDNNIKKHLAIGFVHRNEHLEITGIKLRCINKEYKPRFSARGKLGYYVLSNQIFGVKPSLYVIEGESNAISLYLTLQSLRISCIIISFGGVASIPKKLPAWADVEKKKLIIDYDGKEELYNDRVGNYSHLSMSEIKLELPKGTDINSLHIEGTLANYLNKLL